MSIITKIFNYRGKKWKEVKHGIKKYSERVGIRQLTQKQIDKLIRSQTKL